MYTSPLISFIVPVFNFEAYIGCCIESICKQTYHNIEIIVINDGSTDGTETIVNRYAQTDNRIIPIHKRNEGVSNARNIGIERASGKYVCFVDADDYLSLDFASYMINLAESNGADFCISTMCFTKKGEVQDKKENITHLDASGATALLLSPTVIVGCWNKLFKRSILIEKNIRFSSTLFYGEGLKFITQFAQECNTVTVTDKKLYYYRRNNYSSATTRFNIKNFYNGAKAIDEIEANLKIKTPQVTQMLNWHKCQFRMGTVVRIKSARKTDIFHDYYCESLRYVREHTWECMGIKNISLYKKALLLGCCISPTVMAHLDIWRRKRIVQRSV